MFGNGSLAAFEKKLMKLYVGNLSFSTTEHELRDLFGSSRGFAFGTMGNRNEGQAAITALEGLSHDGRNLTVSEARPKTEPRQNNSFLAAAKPRPCGKSEAVG